MRQFRAAVAGLFLLIPALSFAFVSPGNGVIPATSLVVCPYTGAYPTTIGFSAATLSTNYQLVAPVAGQKVEVYGFWIATLAATNISFTEGTGSACATGNTVVTGTISNGGTNANFTSPAFLVNAPLRTNVVGDALCIKSGTSTTVSGFLTYCQE